MKVIGDSSPISGQGMIVYPKAVPTIKIQERRGNETKLIPILPTTQVCTKQTIAHNDNDNVLHALFPNQLSFRTATKLSAPCRNGIP